MLASRCQFVLCLAVLFAGCNDKTGPSTKEKPRPARVENHPDEAGAYHVTLTTEAVARLGIATAPVENRSLPRRRTFGADVVLPTGSAVKVTAPFPGTLVRSDNAPVPRAGARVESGQLLFSFVPLLSPDREVPTLAERVQMANARASLVSAQTVAAGDAKRAQAEVEANTIALARAERLLEDKAGSARAVDEAKAALQLAQKSLEAAQTRQRLLDGLTLDTKEGRVPTVEITAPQSGILTNLAAVPGQTVVGATALLEVTNLDVLWVRVPLYVGLRDQIDASAEATIAGLQVGATRKSQPARPVAAPPLADPQAATVDLFYEIDNRGGARSPGERVGATLTLKQDAQSLVIPWAAVLYDFNGSEWVYEKVGDDVFRRRRVLVSHTVDDLAVLVHGPDAGAEIVVAGAAELFGTEFGAGK